MRVISFCDVKGSAAGDDLLAPKPVVRLPSRTTLLNFRMAVICDNQETLWWVSENQPAEHIGLQEVRPQAKRHRQAGPQLSRTTRSPCSSS